MVWYGLVQFAQVWFGFVCYGMVWFDMIQTKKTEELPQYWNYLKTLK